MRSKIALCASLAAIGSAHAQSSVTRIPIPSLPSASTLSNDDLVMIDIPNASSPTGYSSRKTTLGAVLAALGGGGSSPSPVAENSAGLTPIIQADQSVAWSSTDAGATVIIPAQTGKAIYVTGWDAAAGSYTSFTLEYGTQITTPCDTGTHIVAGPYPLNVWSPIGRGAGVAYVIPANQQLCGVSANAVPVGGSVSFAAF